MPKQTLELVLSVDTGDATGGKVLAEVGHFGTADRDYVITISVSSSTTDTLAAFLPILANCNIPVPRLIIRSTAPLSEDSARKGPEHCAGAAGFPGHIAVRQEAC